MELLQRVRSMLQTVLILSAFLFVVAGCGGSSGEFDDENNVNSDVITITLAISDPDVSQATPATLTATVMQGSAPLPDRLVSFSISNNSLASFDTDVSDKGTNADGQAVINLIVGTSSGSGTITASLADGTVSNSVLFNSAGDNSGGTSALFADKVSTFASSQQLGSSGSEEITLTTIAQDENNNLMAGVTVSFSTTSGQIEIVNAVTGVDGQATALLKTDNEPANRIVTVTSQSGQASDTVDVQVTGTAININGSSSLAINDETNFFIQVLDSDGEGIASASVELSLMPETTENVAQINIPSSVTMDLNGQSSFTVTGVTQGSNTIIASALGSKSEHQVSVQADSLLFTRFNNGQQIVNPENNSLPDVNLSNVAIIDVTWLQANTPIPDGTEVTFTATRGVLSASNVTTTNGVARAMISSAQAGKTTLTVTAVDGNVTLNNQIEFEFVAETAATLVAQASPNSIGSDGETSTISVVVKDDNGNLVKGQTIDFSLSDVNNGELFPANAITDSNGAASTVYTSNAASSQNGISITAVVRSIPDVSDTVSLTVADKELFIALGTGNSIGVTDNTTYNTQYSAFVTDVDSTPQEGVVLSVSAVPTGYYKGQWVNVNGGWNNEEGKVFCFNEDVNVDGILDVGEDTNSNGELTPGNVVSTLGEVTTDAQGRAIIDILYAKSFATWADINLIVTAKVAGSENNARTIFTLPILASDISNVSISPPGGVESVFGSASDCTNAN